MSRSHRHRFRRPHADHGLLGDFADLPPDHAVAVKAAVERVVRRQKGRRRGAVRQLPDGRPRAGRHARRRSAAGLP